MVEQLSVEQYRAMTTEAEFEKAVIDLAGFLGWECFHVYDPRRFWPGWPDWIAFCPGRHIWFELKREGQKLRRDQEVWQQRIRAAGGECYAWRPSDWPAIEAVLRGDPQ